MKPGLRLEIAQPAPQEYLPKLWAGLFQAWIDALEPDFAGLIQVSFVSRTRMQEFYKQAYGEDHATDVLSLRHSPQPGAGESVSGEIVICSAVAREAARRLKVEPSEEFATLFVHGLLHLAGLEHDTASDQHRFHELTRDIMATQSLKAISLWSV